MNQVGRHYFQLSQNRRLRTGAALGARGFPVLESANPRVYGGDRTCPHADLHPHTPRRCIEPLRGSSDIARGLG